MEWAWCEEAAEETVAYRMEGGLFPAWSLVFAVAFGAAIGSFLNVVIYRMPRGLSLSNPKHSFCPKCEHRLEVPDLFPLLSFLALRGKCRHCKAPVSPRYFIVELLNASLWTAIWYQHLVVGSDPALAIVYSAAASTLLASVFSDLELYIIPDQLNAFLWLVGILFNVWLYVQGSSDAATWGIPNSLAGWIVGVGILWGIALFGRLAFGKDAMGHGDIKMARGIGAVVFPVASVMSFGIAVVLGAVLGIVQVLLRGKPRTPSSASDQSEETNSGAGGQAWQPESIGSLLKCGLGYLLCVDIVGLFVPKVYESWFGEPAFPASEEVEEEFEVEHTMIPFGPYLAMGAIGVLLFRDQLMGLWGAYVNWVFPPERAAGAEIFSHLVHFVAAKLEQASAKESLMVVERALGAII